MPTLIDELDAMFADTVRTARRPSRAEVARIAVEIWKSDNPSSLPVWSHRSTLVDEIERLRTAQSKLLAEVEWHDSARRYRERAERAEADAATLRETVRVFLRTDGPAVPCERDEYQDGYVQGYVDAVEKLDAALTSGGQG
jgi:hypothetical protein